MNLLAKRLIFLKTDIDKILGLIVSRNYTYKKTFNNRKEGPIYKFNYNLGTTELQIYNWIPKAYCAGTDIEQSKQLDAYDVTIMLHWWNEKEMKDKSKARALAITIADISQMIMLEKIPACMPHSVGWNYLYGDPEIKSQRMAYNDL